jgi:hypothetical protein
MSENRRLCLSAPNDAELFRSGTSIVGAVGLEVKTREKPGKSSKFDPDSIRPCAVAFEGCEQA